MASPTSPSELELRVLRLEDRLRRQRRLGALLLLACSAFVLVAAQRPQKPPVLSVSSIEVLDDSGRTAARLGYSSSGGLLELLGSSDRVAISATATGNGGVLTLFDGKAEVSTRVFNGRYGGQFALRRSSGEPSLSLSATLMGGEMTVHDRAGRPIGALKADSRGRGEVRIVDIEGKRDKTLRF